MSECRECKEWKGCPGKEWYHYGEICWCPQQVFWLLKFEEIIHQGEWPAPDATAPGGMSGKTLTEAAFVKVILIIAELDCRIEQAGWRGKVLVGECYKLEKMMYLSDDAKDALYYVAGWKRKDTNFSQWRRQKRYRKRVRA